MKMKLYKNIALSFIVINIWTLYNFFDYYNHLMHDQWGLSGMTLFFNFFESVFAAILVGVLAIILRLTYFRREKQTKLKNSLLYVLTGLFNLNLLVIYCISIIMDFLPLKSEGLYFIIGIFFIAVFILFDLFVKQGKVEIQPE